MSLVILYKGEIQKAEIQRIIDEIEQEACYRIRSFEGAPNTPEATARAKAVVPERILMHPNKLVQYDPALVDEFLNDKLA
ncbi:hypothetical protein P8918_12875 [Bacillus spizizenii]|nr:hypothetical protein [Bacillus spizizenii]MCY8890463.1 hypothetical protein [Bacillus spizizenii]MEC0841918.1 hypothetical protein [Bacillus spizizenii]